jgi:ribosome-associated toxin RatA of RatAB toxin-antitoxin module
MNQLNYLIVIILLCSSFTPGENNDEEWSLVRESDQIQVFKKPTPNGYNAIRIEAVVRAPLKTFIEFVNQVDRYPEWVYKCREAEELDNPVNSTMKYWMVSDFPFPFKDRELTAVSFHHVDERGIFHSASFAEPGSVDDANVVITKFDARWKVTPTAQNEIKIEYEVQTEPGGHIPAWLYNLAVDQGPFKTMQSLKDILENGK